ncbi:hypothetical protein Bca4012_073936 [Brassica carinata]
MVATHHLPYFTRFRSSAGASKLVSHYILKFHCIHSPWAIQTTTFKHHQPWFRLPTSVLKLHAYGINSHMLLESLSVSEHHFLSNIVSNYNNAYI